MVKTQNHSCEFHVRCSRTYRFPTFPASLCSTTFSGGATLPPRELAPSCKPFTSKEKCPGWTRHRGRAEEIAPQGGPSLVLESSRTDKDGFPEGLCLENFLGSGSEKAKGREEVVAAA